eukprot:CAMPEP_0184323350 /NCGR_PEP_ID=MMETSP1049-20130417/129810_1 /TAXON_ID=77928 /ORGANISM="Proteomonas sulcata, Strain CCMP704" /LENGTH=45 /DNA_ID= /DNA_START= /DNA_END= /DNA_ORIENTATION=
MERYPARNPAVFDLPDGERFTDVGYDLAEFHDEYLLEGRLESKGA